jgi:tetratricopeptide (TPR) repeat protein
MKTGLRIMVAGISGLVAAVAAQNSAAPAAKPDQPEDVFESLRTLARENAGLTQLPLYSEKDLAGLKAVYGSAQARIAADQLAQLTTRNLYGNLFGASRDALYERGQMALELRRWEEAIKHFGQVAAAGGPRADGALYWKAYALNKLGRRDEALAALAELRKTHSGSRWLDDAKALEIEVRQAAGKPVPPGAESDDDLKIQAMNGLAHADPERTVPALESVLCT